MVALWKARDLGDAAAREELVEMHLHLVVQTRLRRFAKVPWDMGEELIAEGRLMLVRCVDDFEPARRIQFRTYAITKIWGRMAETLRREDWTPRSEREKERRGENALVYAILSLNQVHTVSEMDGESLTYADTLATVQPTVEEEAFQHMDADALNYLVGGLHSKEQHVLHRHYWEGETLKHIAAQMDCCESWVHQLNKRALLHLREEILVHPL
jgi:RNA polymerase sigma factor for flagellar operon FliA